jgi:phospholipid/cholesterol/gamma-HCH transport system ATP-binding protein
VLLTSEEPVVSQFLEGRRIGPIGMSEEKDVATMALEQAHVDAGHHDGGTGVSSRTVMPQLDPTPGLPVRQAVRRRKDRVMSVLHTLPFDAQQAILASFTAADRARYNLRPGTSRAGTGPAGVNPEAPVNPHPATEPTSGPGRHARVRPTEAEPGRER